MQKNKKENKKSDSNIKWAIEAFSATLILSTIISYASAKGISNLNMISAVFILILVIFIGIMFDIVGTAVTVAKEQEFHAKATKKVNGAKTSIKLIKNASVVANICADIIGDMCGVLSGAISAMISLRITQIYGVSDNIQYLISGLVAALTVGGKALGKEFANNQSTKIVHIFGRVLSKFYK